MLRKPAANAIAAIGSDVSSTIRFARCTRRVAATAEGGAPACSAKSRLRWRLVIPSVSARSPTVLPSSRKPPSISLNARVTVAAAPRHAGDARVQADRRRSEEHTSELQSRFDLVCRLLLEKKKIISHLT